ncbi:hypothetical protein CAL26_04970 [Bordetella genomosp. 9]|uniref:Uncharacterized protein n=2 Tax=Bordetella genomosp. 9 TaxID=1416803 RepID=A0A261RNQ0_9BORD|nr:hypothetical protein CAL26_04970 [Bordetella genomosp. 9]
MRVANSEFIAKRVAEGGYGAELDSKLASPLHAFIYEYDDEDAYRSAWFRHRLDLLLADERRKALEEAAQRCEAEARLCGESPHAGACYQCATDIRSLIEHKESAA